MQVIANINSNTLKEQLYLNVRNKEGRIVSDDLLKQLPTVPQANPYKHEWDIRSNTLKRFINYLRKTCKAGDSILDIGCGNGWMTHTLSQQGFSLTGIDLNMEELIQAERVFGENEYLHWAYADVMNDAIPYAPFKCIILSASCQYFSNIDALVHRLDSILMPGGEIHLTDSIFYRNNEINDAKQRSMDYYTSMGFPEMSEYYFHHSIEELKQLRFKKIEPGLFSKQSPLQWWRYIKP